MKKILTIDGMHCDHCKMRVEQALAALGTKAEVNLKKKTATVEGEALDDERLKAAVADAGFAVTDIRTK